MNWYEVASKFCTGTLTRQNSILNSPTSPQTGTAMGALPPAYAEKHSESPTAGAFAPSDAKVAPTEQAQTSGMTSGATPAGSSAMHGGAPATSHVDFAGGAPTSAAAPANAEKAEIAGKNPV